MREFSANISGEDFLLANRRASRAEEIQAHGKQIQFRSVLQKSKKVYVRNSFKRVDTSNMCPHLKKKLFEPEGVYYPIHAHNKLEYEPAHTCEHILNQTMVRIFGCPRSRNAHIERK